jgi:hypothetical protein
MSLLSQTSQEQFKSDGFLIPSTFNADGNGLPSSKVPTYKDSQLKRNIITWFIPEFGIVRMYVNPDSIQYNFDKIIQKERTKGGFTLQYWGEELPKLTLSGTTGSSGIEGINVLYEIYRAEQYAMDTVGLSLAAASANQSNNVVSNLTGLAGAGSSTSNLLNSLQSVIGLDSDSSLMTSNINSLAQLAFTVEMYYNGWVFRGYFQNMTINERADNFLITYNITFNVTQRRGYRTNYFPWAKSAVQGPSQYTSPPSFSGNVISGL